MSVFGGQTMVCNSLELELQIAVSHLMWIWGTDI